MTTPDETFGDLLRRYRKAAGLTQEALAERADLSVRAIAYMEQGAKQRPHRDTLRALVAALNLTAPERAALEQAARPTPTRTPLAAIPPLAAPPPPTLPPIPATPGMEGARRAPFDNLPAQPTPLIGREGEIAAVAALLRAGSRRLVTLTGAGGTGKTRLALGVAQALAAQFPDGVCFVDLAPLTDPALVITAIAQALGVRERSAQPVIEQVRERLRDKQMLLVFDNFEHVAAAAATVGELLAASRQFKVLVTSRVRLRLRAEHEFPVPPLALPSPDPPLPPPELAQYEAVQLFVARAVACRPDFELTEENAPAVAEICRRLDGLPLALELAAARGKLLPPEMILARLQNRLKLLTSGPQDVPARQQTLRATMDWSHDLLNATEQALFRRLAVFRGGAPLEAVERVVSGEWRVASNEAVRDNEQALEHDPHSSFLIPHSAVLDGLASLIDKSLVRQESAGEARVVMLETIHEYAREKLEQSGEAEELARRHAGYFLALAEAAETHLRGAAQAQWLARLEDAHDNLHAALSRSLEAQGDDPAERWLRGVRLTGALWGFWFIRGYLSEGRRWLALALARSAAPAAPVPLPPAWQRARAKALIGAGALARWQGMPTGPRRQMFEESLALSRAAGDPPLTANALNNLGIVAVDEGDYAAARAFYEETLAIRRSLGDRSGTATALTNLGFLAVNQGDWQAARAFYEESLAIQRELGDRYGAGLLLANLGAVALREGDYAAAHAAFTASLAIRRELGDKQGMGHALHHLALVALERDDNAATISLLTESLKIWRALAARSNLAACLEVWAALEMRRAGPPDNAPDRPTAACARRGATLLGAAATLRDVAGVPMSNIERRIYQQALTSGQALLGPETFAAARQAGQAMTLDQAVAYALTED